MPSPPVVEELEIFEQLGARRGPRGPGGVVDELDLQRGEEALSHRIVPAIAPATHTADDPVLREDPLVVAAGVLARVSTKPGEVQLRSFDGSRDRVVSGWPVLCHG